VVVGTGEGAQGTTRSVLLPIRTDDWGGLQVVGYGDGVEEEEEGYAGMGKGGSTEWGVGGGGGGGVGRGGLGSSVVQRRKTWNHLLLESYGYWYRHI